MNKKLGGALLLAGTAIGSGVISLPMVLAKLGIVGTCAIMVLFAGLTYLTALIRSDLNLNLDAGATLSDVGLAFGCPRVGNFGNFLLKLLHLALMAAYLFGLSSILCSFTGNPISQNMVMLLLAFFVVIGFVMVSNLIIGFNKILFITMSLVFVVLVAELFHETSITFIPRQVGEVKIKEWAMLIPVIFTSFGFQGSIHSMTKFCQNDRRAVKSACLWGSIIPACVYIIWTIAILLVVSNNDQQFFQRMVDGQATDVGELVAVLSNAASARGIRMMVWVVSVLAMLTSVLGVGISLLDVFQQEWKNAPRWVIASFIVLVPAAVSMLVPNAFLMILNFAGVILALIAIIVPVVISCKMRKLNKLKRIELLLRNKWAIFGISMCGLGIVVLSLINLIG